MEFNLVTAKWIPVLYRDGRFDRVGIRQALTEAGKIRQIAASNPMDNVALLRFLLAVALWCKDDAKSAFATLSDGSMGIPEDWLAKLDDRKAAFNLLGDGTRFYQDKATGGNRVAAANLIHEFPSGSKIAHFRHCLDKREGLCLACCAVALVRWPLLASAGTAGAGQSMTASLNGNTPAYSVQQSANLLATLSRESPRSSTVEGDCPLWEGASEDSPLGILKGLTWRTRQVQLILENAAGVCASCGSNHMSLVYEVFFRPGWKRPSSDPWADDPQLLRVDGRSGKKIIPGWPGPNDSTEAHATVWSKALAGILARRCDLVSDARHQAVGAASEQALYKDIAAYSFRLPQLSEEIRSRLQEMLRRHESVARNTVSARTAEWGKPPKGHCVVEAIRGPKAQGSSLRAAFSALSPDLSRSLESKFLALAASANVECCHPWSSPELNDTTEVVVRSTTPGSPLRRREAIRRAKAALNRTLETIPSKNENRSQRGEASQTKDADVPKPKRGRKKKESGT